MKTPTTTTKPRKADVFTVFIAVVGLASSFANIYKFAHKAEPGNAVWAGIAVFAFSMILATQLARMRQRKV